MRNAQGFTTDINMDACKLNSCGTADWYGAQSICMCAPAKGHCEARAHAHRQ